MMRYRFRVRLIVTLVLTALISAYLAFSGVGNGLYVWVLLVGLAYSLRWLAKNAGELLRSAASYAFLSILSGSLMAFLIVVVVLILQLLTWFWPPASAAISHWFGSILRQRPTISSIRDRCNRTGLEKTIVYGFMYLS